MRLLIFLGASVGLLLGDLMYYAFTGNSIIFGCLEKLCR